MYRWIKLSGIFMRENHLIGPFQGVFHENQTFRANRDFFGPLNSPEQKSKLLEGAEPFLAPSWGQKSFGPCVSERHEASGALKRTYLTVKGGRRIALITTFTALRGMSRIAHSITSGSPLWRHRSQPTIRPNIPSGVPRGSNPGHSCGKPESKPLVQLNCLSW